MPETPCAEDDDLAYTRNSRGLGAPRPLLLCNAAFDSSLYSDDFSKVSAQLKDNDYLGQENYNFVAVTMLHEVRGTQIEQSRWTASFLL